MQTLSSGVQVECCVWNSKLVSASQAGSLTNELIDTYLINRKRFFVIRALLLKFNSWS